MLAWPGLQPPVFWGRWFEPRISNGAGFFFIERRTMSKIAIDGQEYDFDSLPPDARQKLQMLQFVDAELNRLAAQNAAMQTAKAAYANALREELKKINTVSPFLAGDTIKLG